MEINEKQKQKRRIISHFESGKTLTSLEAQKLYSIARLAARISELKADGYNITKVMVEDVNQFGDKVRYARYGLRTQ